MTTRTRAAVAWTAAALLLTGCGDSGREEEDTDDLRMVLVAAAARSIQEAVNEADWQTVCEGLTERFRVGSIDDCVEDYAEEDRGDWEFGSVTTGATVEVAAVGDHPAGIGVLVSYEASSLGDTMTMEEAWRMVFEQGEWRVDQVENLSDEDGYGQAAVRGKLFEEGE